jgi:ATP-dependent DNA helicase PIF1
VKQREALAIMESGRSALLTGAAGSGKTFLLERFIRRARRSGKRVAVTATTGLAATHLGGTTIHAWSGIGVADSLPSGHVHRLSRQRVANIDATDILVIDEVSMLHDFRLDMVDAVCREVRENGDPFGGLQVILCGDFFQLPPVNRQEGRVGGFVTGSRAWSESDLAVLYLDEQHRQRDDAPFRAILNALRRGGLQGDQLAMLNERIGASLPAGLTATRLHTVNVDVDAENERELSRLDGPGTDYPMTSSGTKQYVDQLKRSCLASETLSLKVGALVMFIKNAQDRAYANGSLGAVTGFEEGTGLPLVKLARGGKVLTVRPESWELVDGDTRRAQITQVPLRLAWAITVHKSQGMTLDAAEIDLRRAFTPGMGYVALSRVGRLDRLALRGLGRIALKVSDEALAIEADLQAASTVALGRHAAAVDAAPAAGWEEVGSPGAGSGGTGSREAGEEGDVAAAWADRLAELRETHPNAYRPWSAREDARLRELFEGGVGLAALTEAFGRNRGAIRSRLKKQYGEDVTIGA